MVRYRLWPRCSPPLSPPTTPGKHFSLASPPLSVPESQWPLPRAYRTTDLSPGVVHHGSAARLRRDDRHRRARSYLALPDPAFPDRNSRGDYRRGHRTCNHLVDTHALHGYALPEGGVPGGGRRYTRVRCGHIDRQFVAGYSRYDVHNCPSFRSASCATAPGELA